MLICSATKTWREGEHRGIPHPSGWRVTKPSIRDNCAVAFSSIIPTPNMAQLLTACLLYQGRGQLVNELLVAEKQQLPRTAPPPHQTLQDWQGQKNWSPCPYYHCQSPSSCQGFCSEQGEFPTPNIYPRPQACLLHCSNDLQDGHMKWGGLL